MRQVARMPTRGIHGGKNEANRSIIARKCFTIVKTCALLGKNGEKAQTKRGIELGVCKVMEELTSYSRK